MASKSSKEKIVNSQMKLTQFSEYSHFLRTKFCRFLVSTILLTQNITKGKFIFVPNLSMKEKWDDEKLYAKYGFTVDEIAFIESMIRPMDLSNTASEDE